jgi:DinB family protein
MTTAVDWIHAEVKRLHGMFDTSIPDLTAEQLHAVPASHPNANTIAWSLWHCVRTEDNVVRFVLQDRRPTVWAEGGYAGRLGLPPVAQGTGMSAADAQALRITDVPLFREYMKAVQASTEELFVKAAPGFFDKVVTIKPLGEMPAFRAIGQVIVGHGFMHFGQIELIRTLVGAKPAIGV